MAQGLRSNLGASIRATGTQVRIMDCSPTLFIDFGNRLPNFLKRVIFSLVISSILIPSIGFAALRNAKKSASSSKVARSVKAAPKNSFSVSPTSITVPPGATNGVINVVTKNVADLKVSNLVPWIKVTSPSTRAFRSGERRLNYSITPNTSCTNRTGVFFVKDQAVTITQIGMAANYDISLHHASFSTTGGEGSVLLTANCLWTVVTDSPWITVTSPATGSDNSTITYTVSAHGGDSARAGTIKILDGNSVVKRMLTIGQNGNASPSYSLNATEAEFTFYGGSTVVELTANAAWSVQSDAAWITGISPANGVSDATIKYSVEPNSSCMSRNGTIKILDAKSVVQQTLLVTQTAVAGGYTLSSSYLLFPSSGGRISVGLSARCDWTVQTDADWISNIVPSSGSTNATIFYTVAENTLVDGRQGYIRVLDGNSVVRQTLRIVQTGVQPTYWLNPTSSGFPASGGSSNVTLTANSSWIAQADVDWITNITSGNGSTNAVVQYTVAANTNAASRVGNIQILDGTFAVRETLSIIQSGATGSMAASSSTSFNWINSDADGKAVATDDDGSVVIAASIEGNLYVEKTAADGTARWAKAFGGDGQNFVQSIALDGGNVLLVGSFSTRINFGTTPEHELAANGETEIFLTKLSGDDGGYLWANRLGDFSNDEANAVAKDFLSKQAP